MKKTILIIEDNEDIRESTCEILLLAGFEVLKAENGKTGIDLAQKKLPDLILCDIMMPELDGYGVLYLLNKNPETAAIPFIFLTAKADRVDLRRGMEMGADDYLTKPFDDLELLNAIESRISKKEKQIDFISKSLQNLSQITQNHNGFKELEKVIAERKARVFKKKQIIYFEGDQAQGIYLILSGKVKTSKLSTDGRELLTDMHGSDEYLGVHSFLSDGIYHETAEALEDTTLCLLSKEVVDDLLHRYPDVTQQFIKLLSNNLLEKEEQLLQLAYHSVRKRLAEVLLRLTQQQRLNTKDEGVSIKISREDLAAMAGMASETVSRTLSDFKSEGLIDKQGSQIHLLNIKQMKNMKN